MAKTTSDKNRLIVYDKFKGRCAYCGDNIEYSSMHLDHIKPRFRGSTDKELYEMGITRGTNKVDNLNPSCSSCNISKSTFTIEDWRIDLNEKPKRLRKTQSSFRLMEKFGKIKEIKTPIVFYFEKPINF
jgi:5-methylcytosine-specific restriction endonuclease McrA